ncbi:cell division protein FtsW [Corynebacterium accolens]|nr:cell division protein FtsW [Corynebacterium accolens]MDK4336316.1 cell division protein FtsW [Corynebacterium accolens]
MVIAEFYVSQVTGWRGVSSSNVEGVSWSAVSSDGIVLHVVGYMAFYLVLVLPIFLVRRYLLEKRQKQGSEPDEKGKDEQP